MESPPIEREDLKCIASALKLVSITEGLLWFVASYAGLGVSLLAWGTVIGFGVAFASAFSADSPALLLPLQTSAFAAILFLGVLVVVKAALRWRNLRGLPILLLIASSILCFPGFLLMMAIYVPGFVGRSRLKKLHAGYRTGEGGMESVANILERDGSLESAANDKKRRARRWVIAKIFIKYGGILLLLTGVNQIIGTLVGQVGNLTFSVVFTIFTLPIGIGIAFIFSTRITRRLHDSRRLLAPESANARAFDSRPPILVLRSFKDEPQLSAFGKIKFLSLSRSVINSFEEHMTDRLWRFGPVIAMGRPGEDSPPAGAAREYLRQEEWQGRFADLAASCAAIVVIAGVTPGIAWEVRHIIDHNLYDRLLIVLPPWMTQEEWSTFCEGIGNNCVGLTIEDAKNRLLGVRLIGNQLCTYYGPPDQFGFEALSITATIQIMDDNQSKLKP
jgi:hypothetical protein